MKSVIFWHFFQSSDLVKPGETDATPAVNPKDPEDIPTFDEWKKKVMEVEKEKSKIYNVAADFLIYHLPLYNYMQF